MSTAFKTFAAVLLTLAVGFGAARTADAAVIGVDLGTAAPPATLGGITMTPFGADPTPDFTDVNGVATPVGGSLSFDNAVNKRTIGNGWATWSHGYTGDVYYSAADTLVITLPAAIRAFYFYVEPNIFSVFEFLVTEASGESFTTSINGDAGANGFGFYGTAGSLITSITITAPSSAGGFAVGEFGIAAIPVPAAGLLLLTAIGGIAALRRRRAA